MIPIDDNGELDLSGLDESPRRGKRQSRSDEPRLELARHDQPDLRSSSQWAHEQGAIFVCDAAQAAPHSKVDVQALGVDFLAISGHKMCGPSGDRRALGSDRAASVDGAVPDRRPHDLDSVRLERTTWGELPHKFEAGHGADGGGGRPRRGDRLPRGNRPRAIEAHEHELAAYALEPARRRSPGIKLYGPPADRRAGIVSFNVEGIHPHDVAQILDWQGVAIRAGHHCCQPLMQSSASRRRTARASTSTPSPKRSTSSSTGRNAAEGVRDEHDETLYREVILDHYKNPRGHGVHRGRRRRGRGEEPALRRRGLDLRRVRRGRRDDRRGQVRRPRLRDLAGRDVDAHGDGEGTNRDGRRGRSTRTSCSRRSASR